MALPLTRNTTYVASDPIKAADLNALQDSVIGGKHGALDIAVPASDFMVQTGTATLGTGQWTFGAVTLLNAPVKLPVGAKIASLTWSYNRGGAGNMTFRLKRRARGGGAVTDVDTTGAISAGTGFTTTVRNPNHTIAAGYQYYLEVQADNAANIFEDVVMGITKE